MLERAAEYRQPKHLALNFVSVSWQGNSNVICELVT